MQGTHWMPRKVAVYSSTSSKLLCRRRRRGMPSRRESLQVFRGRYTFVGSPTAGSKPILQTTQRYLFHLLLFLLGWSTVYTNWLLYASSFGLSCHPPVRTVAAGRVSSATRRSAPARTRQPVLVDVDDLGEIAPLQKRRACTRSSQAHAGR